MEPAYAARIVLYVSRIVPNDDDGDFAMTGSLSASELDDRIAILRDNIRQLVEQAAAAAGSANEERASSRSAEQSAELEKLTKQRDELAKKKS